MRTRQIQPNLCVNYNQFYSLYLILIFIYQIPKGFVASLDSLNQCSASFSIAVSFSSLSKLRDFSFFFLFCFTRDVSFFFRFLLLALFFSDETDRSFERGVHIYIRAWCTQLLHVSLISFVLFVRLLQTI